MTNDVVLSLLYAGWVAASTMPLGFMLGAPCSPCCRNACGDTKPVTDPKDEGTWVPSGAWLSDTSPTWSFVANTGDESGETWFFFGSAATSKPGGGATAQEQADWGNLCNWYSNKTTSPNSTGFSGAAVLSNVLNRRATRLPPEGAVVHAYSRFSTSSVGPQTVKTLYVWNVINIDAAGTFEYDIATTSSAHGVAGGAVFVSAYNNTSGVIRNGASFFYGARNYGTVNNGAEFSFLSIFFGFGPPRNFGVVNGGAVFSSSSTNGLTGSTGTVNDGATFNNTSGNSGTVNDGATFNDSSGNSGTVNDGATFNDTSDIGGGTVNGGAVFNNLSVLSSGTVNDGAVFNNSSRRSIFGTLNGGAIFNDSSENEGTVNGGATFNDNSENAAFGTVNGGATFNDAACSKRGGGDFFATPCSFKFVAHPTDLPTCNGTAPDGCQNFLNTCGCG